MGRAQVELDRERPRRALRPQAGGAQWWAAGLMIFDVISRDFPQAFDSFYIILSYFKYHFHIPKDPKSASVC